MYHLLYATIPSHQRTCINECMITIVDEYIYIYIRFIHLFGDNAIKKEFEIYSFLNIRINN